MSNASAERLLIEAGQQGLPRWATIAMLSTWFVAALLAAISYAAAHTWWGVFIFGLIGSIVTVGIMNAASLLRKKAAGLPRVRPRRG